MQRLPGIALFVLGKTHGELHRVAERRALGTARVRTADVADRQPARRAHGDAELLPSARARRGRAASAASGPDFY